MSQGQCPQCGAPVDFRPGAGQVKVCEHCRAVVVRGKVSLETMGQVAQLVDTEPPIKVGLFGTHQNVGFRIVGRVQKSHGTGVWDEWALAFDDGRTGWLAESEGEWKLTFPIEGAQVGTFDAIDAGTAFSVKDQRFVVEEKGLATTVSAQGQLPGFAPEGPYIDATGRAGLFCTIDYGGETPEVFIGSLLPLSELGFSRSDLEPQPRKESLKGATCTQCRGPLDLKAPDQTKRVACPYCGALLDVRHGELAFLQLLEQPKVKPALPLGAEGTLGGTKWTVLAFLVRSCVVEGNRYPWEEYLLFNREQGFRWVMRSNEHWTFLTPIPAGEVVLQPRGARYTGRPIPRLQPEKVAPNPKTPPPNYELFQSVNVTTDVVQGECYWEVEVGEQAWAAEYIAPPCSLNLDRTANEVTFTFGEIIDATLLQTAFGLKAALLPPRGTAPASKNPWKARAKDGFVWAGIWSAALVVLGLVFGVMSEHGRYLRQTFDVVPGEAPGSPEAQRFSEPFEIPKATPLTVGFDTFALDQRWVAGQVDLVHEETGEVISVQLEVSHYSGYDDGESWSEGSLSDTKTTDEVPAGRYVARLTPSWDAALPPTTPLTVTVDAEGGGSGFCCMVLFLVLLFVPPIFSTIRSSAFETARWEESVRQMPSFREGPVKSRRQPIALDEDDDEEDDA